MYKKLTFVLLATFLAQLHAERYFGKSFSVEVPESYRVVKTISAKLWWNDEVFYTFKFDESSMDNAGADKTYQQQLWKCILPNFVISIKRKTAENPMEMLKLQLGEDFSDNDAWEITEFKVDGASAQAWTIIDVGWTIIYFESESYAYTITIHDGLKAPFLYAQCTATIFDMLKS